MTVPGDRPDAGRETATRPWPRISPVRRLGPAVVLLAALVAAGVLATVHDSGSATGTGPAAAVPGRPVAPGSSGAGHSSLAVTYAAAKKAGRTSDYHWAAGCDFSTGRLRIPSIYAMPCVPVFHGSNGGATAGGVTSTTVTVVYYQAPPGDLASAIEGAAGTPATNLETAENYVAMFNHVLPLDGRHVVLVNYDATGDSNDAVAARADAIRVAQQIHAFASIGGPAQTPAYEDELARLHVLCLSCGLGATYTSYQADAPYLWGLLPTPDTLLTEAFRYVFTQLMHHDAVYAGEASFRRHRRVFALVHYDESPPVYTSLTAELDHEIKAAGLHLALNESYLLDLSELPSEAATIAEHLKRVGASTVIFAGDPIMPIYLTKACDAIGYFPEWVITGTVFTDSSTLGRLYDQKEWAHAFGITSLAVPTPIQLGDAYRLYRWYYGTTPPAPMTAVVLLPQIEELFDGLELAGPRLTAASFAGGIFELPPAGGGPTTPLASFGYNGAPPRPSYATPADYTFIWYDATAKGSDEEGVPGTGMVRYVAGGRRYPATAGPATPVPMFQVAGAVTTYPVYPPGGTPPTYPPWPGSPVDRAGAS
ncbi:MAG TPA: hypothetical protein VN799_06395 [Acidimicrobiales bacterium]|nr:hypothetical protein [Acidimicrobiales bacterium]